jgi:hypothetical protein
MLFKRTGNNPYCIHRALDLEAQGLRERVVRVERAPGEPFDGGRFEIVLEEIPATADDGPTIAGLRPDEVLAISADRPSIWDEATIRERLARS